jgi:hypothetical protein
LAEELTTPQSTQSYDNRLSDSSNSYLGIVMRAIASGLCALLLSFVAPSQIGLAQDLPSLHPSHPEEIFTSPGYQEYKVEGRVILYARSWPAGSPNQEFVVKTKVENMPLVRVIYLPACCFDSPPVPLEDMFDETQFAIPHTQWRLTVHSPHWDWEKDACSSEQMTVRYVNEEGKPDHEEPRFQPVAGEENDAIPSLLALPCLILKTKGWVRSPQVKSSARRSQ